MAALERDEGVLVSVPVPRKTRPHGTHVKYVVERCRCDECREATLAYERQRRRDNYERQWGVRPPIFVDAGDTRDHILRLRKAGIGPRQIERLSGVGHTAQWKIVSGRVKRVRRETEAAICDVETHDHVFLRSKVDATQAKEIIAELLGMGITKTAIARALGAKTDGLQVAKGDRCTLLTLKRLRILRQFVMTKDATS